MNTIAAVAPTLCRLLGAEPPALSAARPLRLPAGAAGRVLLHAADAIGRRFLARHPELERRLRPAVGAGFALRSVVPPKTPVCFATMLTGAPPERHGIRRYEKPPLAVDTAFDALARAGRRSAVVAVRGSSCAAIFRGRAADSYIEEYDPDVTARTLELMRRDEYDLILAYHQEYDDTLHRTTPDSPAALAAAGRHADAWLRFRAAADEYWRGRDRVLWFAPDHGAHLDPATGRGTHGDDIPDDMEVTHYLAFGRAAG